MASGYYTHASYLLATAGLDLSSGTLKVLLVGSANGGYVFNPAHTYVDNGSSDSTNVKYNELVATNYTRGYGGSGRKATTRTVTEDPSNNRTKVVFSNITWAGLGGATNDTVNGAILVKEVGNDAGSLLIAYWALSSTPTNGSDITLTMDPTNGNLRLNV